jgi:hypothetical protein
MYFTKESWVISYSGNMWIDLGISPISFLFVWTIQNSDTHFVQYHGYLKLLLLLLGLRPKSRKCQKLRPAHFAIATVIHLEDLELRRSSNWDYAKLFIKMWSKNRFSLLQCTRTKPKTVPEQQLLLQRRRATSSCF